MLLQLEFLINHLPLILFFVLIVFLTKSTLAAIAVAVLRYPLRTVLLTGLSLFQVGEFAFILSKVGIKYNLLTEETNQYFLSISIISMILTPFVIILSERIVFEFLGVSKKIGFKSILASNDLQTSLDKAPDLLTNHLVIIGFGVNGRNLSKAANYSGIPYVVVEMNADTVKREKGNGIPIVYGDAIHDHILELVNLHDARCAVVAISDDAATKAIIKQIRSISTTIYLIVRTRYVKETKALLALGADEVIPEEFETSVQIFTHVMQNFLVPEDDIDSFVENLRSDDYALFNSDKKRPKTFKPKQIADFNITCLRLGADSSAILGVPLKTLNLRSTHGINILAIRRNDEMLETVAPDENLKQGDIIYIQGNQSSVEAFHRLVR
jgi:CPA2 family monovalent cation:H+ antiporter-2